MAKKATIMTVLGWDDTALVRGARKATEIVGVLSRTVAALSKPITLGITAPIKALAWSNQAMEGIQRLTGPLMKVGELMKDSVFKSASMESTLLSYEVMLKSANKANKLMAEIVEFEAKTPMTLTELTDSVTALLAYGEPAKQMVDTLAKIGDVASSLPGNQFKDIALLYGKARVENKLMTRDLNEFQGRGIDMLGGISEYLFGNTDQKAKVKEMIEDALIGFREVEAVFNNLTAKGAPFFDMMTRQSGTFLGLLSTFKSASEQLQRDFGTPIMQELKPMMIEFTAWMATQSGKAKEFGEAIGKALAPMVGMFKNKTLLEYFGKTLWGIMLKAGNLLMAAMDVAGSKLNEAMNFDPRKTKMLKAMTQMHQGVFAAAANGIGDPHYKSTPLGSQIIANEAELNALKQEGVTRQAADMEAAVKAKMQKEGYSPTNREKVFAPPTPKFNMPATLSGNINPLFAQSFMGGGVDLMGIQGDVKRSMRRESEEGKVNSLYQFLRAEQKGVLLFQKEQKAKSKAIPFSEEARWNNELEKKNSEYLKNINEAIRDLTRTFQLI